MHLVRSVRHRLLSFTLFVLVAIAPSITARAGDISNSSLKGTYSFLTNRWTANPSTEQFGMVGVMRFNGMGGVTGSFTSMTGTTVATGSLAGTYAVVANGSGSIKLTTGSTAQFAIALSSASAGVARAVHLLQTNDSENEVVSGSAVLQSATTGTYNLASMNGEYAIQLNTWTAESTEAEDGDLALLSFDGKGNIKGTVNSMYDGTLSTNTVTGTYTVNTNGSGTFTLVSNNNPQFEFVLNTVASGVAAGAQILATSPGNGAGNYVISGVALKQ
jgi:hypothetical protein